MPVIDPEDHIDRDGHQAEDAAADALRSAGLEALNLNREVAGNFPVIDLIARRGTDRLLIQVRGTITDHGSYRTPPWEARRAESFGDWLGRPALYAFVHFTADNITVHFETASQVAALAEAAEADYPGDQPVPRLHRPVRRRCLPNNRTPRAAQLTCLGLLGRWLLDV
jgi:hypothetical protein